MYMSANSIEPVFHCIFRYALRLPGRLPLGLLPPCPTAASAPSANDSDLHAAAAVLPLHLAKACKLETLNLVVTRSHSTCGEAAATVAVAEKVVAGVGGNIQEKKKKKQEEKDCVIAAATVVGMLILARI